VQHPNRKRYSGRVRSHQSSVCSSQAIIGDWTGPGLVAAPSAIHPSSSMESRDRADSRLDWGWVERSRETERDTHTHSDIRHTRTRSLTSTLAHTHIQYTRPTRAGSAGQARVGNKQANWKAGQVAAQELVLTQAGKTLSAGGIR
jgi:hypothetical protein